MSTAQFVKRAAVVGSLLAAIGFSSLTSAAAVVSATYNLGTSSAAGAVNVPPDTCQGGADSLRFTGSGSNNIGIHTYSCDYYGTNGATTSFGSRSSGENTYYVDGSVVVNETFTGSAFTFHVSAGEVGAFGSTLFGAGEFQNAELAVRMLVDGVLILDQSWSTYVGANGATTSNYFLNPLADAQIGFNFTSGTGFVTYDLFDLYQIIGLGFGSHTVTYSITSKAFGNVNAGSAAANNCFAPTYYTDPVGGGGGGVPGGGEGENNLQFALAAVAEGGGTSRVSCGAGARSGDPFNLEPGIAGLAADNAVPLPAPLALLGLGLFGLALRRRAA
jgi:hypothetical protein